MDEYYDEMNEYFDSMPLKYSVVYSGAYYCGDSDSYNCFDTDSFDKAMEVYRDVCQYDEEACIKDNYYGVTFSHGEWY